MRTFILIWFGQLISTVGSYMTYFALILWAWQLTGSATALALVGFFFQVPQVPITLVAGLIVDRVNRKTLMIFGDAIAALSTLGLGTLYLTDGLAIWHLYLFAAINGGFGQIQQLAYQASVSLLVSEAQLIRANSMNAAVHYGSSILSPALAGVLYPAIGLLGILGIDLVTFAGAIATLIFAIIPQPVHTDPEPKTLTHSLTFGFRYIWKQPHLKALLLITALFWFFHDLGGAIYNPMLLARSNGSAQVLASTGAAAGIGGVIGAIILTIWGGPKRRMQGILIGFMGAGLAKTIFGFGRSLQVWIPGQFCSSLNFPLLSSSETALWMENTAPEIQGRVFAANSLVHKGLKAVASLIAGPLADRIFEPLVQSKVVTGTIGPVFGTQPGAGIALLYVLTSLALIWVGIGGYCLPVLRRVGKTMPVAN